MSERRLILFAALLLAAPLPAQERVVLQARVRALRSELAEVEHRMRQRDSLTDAGLGWRRLRTGRVTLEVSQADSATAQAALGLVEARLVAVYGQVFRSGETLLLRATPRVRGAGEGAAAGEPVGVSVQFTGDAMPGQPVSAPYVPAGAPPEAMAAAIALVASEAMWYGVDRALARWHPPPPLAAPESLLARRTFVELATSDFPSGALCLGGSLAACRHALGLVPQPADIVASYPPRDRRAFVRRLAQGAVGERAGLTGQCLQLGQQSACDAVLRGREWGPLVPLGESARQQLLALALARGGPGALARLLRAPERLLEARLADAAGESADSLLGRWLEQTRSARAVDRDDTPRSALAAVGWSLVLFGLAVGSVRWR